jgi:hypothetical protein
MGVGWTTVDEPAFSTFSAARGVSTGDAAVIAGGIGAEGGAFSMALTGAGTGAARLRIPTTDGAATARLAVPESRLLSGPFGVGGATLGCLEPTNDDEPDGAGVVLGAAGPGDGRSPSVPLLLAAGVFPWAVVDGAASTTVFEPAAALPDVLSDCRRSAVGLACDVHPTKNVEAMQTNR